MTIADERRVEQFGKDLAKLDLSGGADSSISHPLNSRPIDDKKC